MKNYTSTDPVFADTISIVEERDLVNADNNNAAPMQLLQNTLVLQALKVDKADGKGLVSDAERTAWNEMYEQATGYTNQKIADLINGAPSTLDTLGEIAKAMQDNADVVEALNAAIGEKANATEMESLLDTKLDQTGDAKDAVVTFTSSDTTSPSGWANFALLEGGVTLKALFATLSTMARNLRFLHTSLGGFRFYPEELTQAQYDALPAATKNTEKMIFIVRKE